jgi:hypothetical protein
MVVLCWVVCAVFEGAEVVELLVALLMELGTVLVKTVKRLGPPQGSAVLPGQGILQLATGCWIEPPCRVLSQKHSLEYSVPAMVKPWPMQKLMQDSSVRVVPSALYPPYKARLAIVSL